MRFTTQLLPSRSGNLGVLTLNNPKPLHALTLDMIHCFQDVLKAYYADDGIAAVLIKASNAETKKPAFCAGGDVKQVYLSGKQASDDNGNPLVHGQGQPGLDTAEFFRQEYYVNHMLATANKPQVSLWDGIVMGGGAGISVHGKYRVATERTVFAMPETGIGLFPDVGSLFWMPRLLGPSVAAYLALTGARLKAPDLLKTGLATHYVPSDKLDDLETALVLASQSLQPTETSPNVVAPVLMSFHEIPPSSAKSSLDKAAIEDAFGGAASVEEILSRLESMNNAFGNTTLETIKKMSPTSMKVTLEGLKRGAQCATITDDLAMEFRLSQAFMRNHDFYEGIRAILIDKDQKPAWKPATLEDASSEMVESYFDEIDHEWEIPDELVIKTTETSKL